MLVFGISRLVLQAASSVIRKLLGWHPLRGTSLTKLPNSHQRCSYIKEGVLKNFAKFTGKHLCQVSFFNRLWHRCFLVNFAKFLRRPFYKIPLVADSIMDDIVWIFQILRTLILWGPSKSILVNLPISLLSSHKLFRSRYQRMLTRKLFCEF